MNDYNRQQIYNITKSALTEGRRATVTESAFAPGTAEKVKAVLENMKKNKEG